VLVPEAYMAFDGNGRLVDETAREDLSELLAALARETVASPKLVAA
jgi:hypothetical protein